MLWRVVSWRGIPLSLSLLIVKTISEMSSVEAWNVNKKEKFTCNEVSNGKQQTFVFGKTLNKIDGVSSCLCDLRYVHHMVMSHSGARFIWILFDFFLISQSYRHIDSIETIPRVLCCNHWPWWFPGLNEAFRRTGSNQKSVWSSQLLHLSYFEISSL